MSNSDPRNDFSFCNSLGRSNRRECCESCCDQTEFFLGDGDSISCREGCSNNPNCDSNADCLDGERYYDGRVSQLQSVNGQSAPLFCCVVQGADLFQAFQVEGSENNGEQCEQVDEDLFSVFFSPTALPSFSPTDPTTTTPTDAPTISPTVSPSLVPTSSPTASPSQFVVTTPPPVGNAAESDDSGSDSSPVTMIGLLGGLISLSFFVIGFVLLRRKKENRRRSSVLEKVATPADPGPGFGTSEDLPKSLEGSMPEFLKIFKHKKVDTKQNHESIPMAEVFKPSDSYANKPGLPEKKVELDNLSVKTEETLDSNIL